MKKRGVSPVIATVLILLLTVAAVALLAGFVIPFVKKELPKSSECLNYRDYFNFQEVFTIQGQEYRYNCHQNGKYGISIKAVGTDDKLAENVAGFSLAFVENGSSERVDVLSGQDANSSEGGIRMLNSSTSKIAVPEQSGVNTYVYNSGKSFYSVEVYPKLKSGRICERGDAITFIDCGSNINLSI